MRDEWREYCERGGVTSSDKPNTARQAFKLAVPPQVVSFVLEFRRAAGDERAQMMRCVCTPLTDKISSPPRRPARYAGDSGTV